MRAEPVALIWIKRLFEQGAEDRRVNRLPGITGGLPQFADFLAAKRKCSTALKEFTIEFLHFRSESVRPTASVHRFPKLGNIVAENVRVLLAFFQGFLERFFRQQPDVFREHREQAAQDRKS